MNRTYFVIQQHSGHQFEALQDGSFETLAAAQSAMAELERDLQWRDMRIAEYVETDTEHKLVQVVEYGIKSDSAEGYKI